MLAVILADKNKPDLATYGGRLSLAISRKKKSYTDVANYLKHAGYDVSRHHVRAWTAITEDTWKGEAVVVDGEITVINTIEPANRMRGPRPAEIRILCEWLQISPVWLDYGPPLPMDRRGMHIPRTREHATRLAKVRKNEREIIAWAASLNHDAQDAFIEFLRNTWQLPDVPQDDL